MKTAFESTNTRFIRRVECRAEMLSSVCRAQCSVSYDVLSAVLKLTTDVIELNTLHCFVYIFMKNNKVRSNWQLTQK